ncbi:Hypp1407 [Branchiostoma lanceolatum]|uniref:Hypp1407 protein n=1 Tax=Branchiostoma lanceolatum TaxID=7740 RepID=A0A8K0EKR0_BRALA|nr:Hypp1407 [Branchiostoma lanceolatum]
MGEGGETKWRQQWLEPSLVLERHCTAWSSLTTCCLLQFEEDFAAFGHDFCVSLAMSEFFEPSLGGAYPTMSIYGEPLYADVLGPFYGIESGGSFPTTSPTVSSDSIQPPGWEDKTVQDLKDIWKDPEESLLSKYTSTVERDDVPQIEELARLFVFRAKTSPRWLPYYTGLSPTETPCPELQVQATESPGATPTHDDIRVLARDDEMQDVEDWINGAPDLDISSMLQEAGCDLFSCSDGENMSVATSTGQFTGDQTPEGDLIGCEEPHDLNISSVLQEAGCDQLSVSDGENMSVATDSVLFPGWGDKTVHHDLQDIWMDKEESYHSTVEREDVTQIEELARLFVFRAKTSPRWLPYYTGLSPSETPCPELQVQATESPGATPTHDDIRVLARDDEMQDVEDWLNGAPDLDISSMLQEAGCDLLSCSDGENMSVVTSIGQFTSGQTPEGDRPVLIGCEEPQSSQCVASFTEEDDKSDILDLTSTTNDSQAERPLPCLLFERQSPVNTPKPSSPATELLLTPVYDDSCARYPDHPSCAEEPPSPKCTSVVERDDWAMIAAVATILVFRAKHSLRHVPYYTCQSPAGTPLSTPRLAVEGSWVHEDVQSLAKRAEEEDIADWVNGMCGTGEDVQGLAKKVDQEDTQEFVNEMCDDQSAPATLMHQDQDLQVGLAKKVDKEDTQEFVKEMCGDQSTPTSLIHQDVQGLVKKDDKEEIQDFVGDQSTPTTLMHQGKDLQGLPKEVDKEDSQDFVSKTCGDRATVTPTTPTHKGEDVNDLAKEVFKESPRDLVQTTPTALLYQDAQGLEKEEQDNSVLTDMCDDSHQTVPTTLTGQNEDTQAKTVDKEDQGKLVTEKDTKAKTDEPKKRGGKWWDLRIKRERMVTGRTNGSNNDKKDAKERRKWWRRVFTRKNGGKTSGNDSENEETTKDSNTKWWKIGSKNSVKSQDGPGIDDKKGKIRGRCICM